MWLMALLVLIIDRQQPKWLIVTTTKEVTSFSAEIAILQLANTPHHFAQACSILQYALNMCRYG
jgi:hypothetical protein